MDSAKLAESVEKYLAEGGTIRHIPTGVSVFKDSIELREQMSRKYRTRSLQAATYDT
jgi:hypothetical protein